MALVYQLAQDAATGKPVWITEVNLRSPDDECGPEHQAAQADYLMDALSHGYPVVSILVYADYENWQCTGIRGTEAAETLLTGYPAP